jgi:hypothetical protein
MDKLVQGCHLGLKLSICISVGSLNLLGAFVVQISRINIDLLTLCLHGINVIQFNNLVTCITIWPKLKEKEK